MNNTINQPTQLDANGLRQALRIAGGCTLGFAISKLLNWPNGIFFTVYPMLILGLVPTINKSIIIQFSASAGFSALVVLLMQGLFSHLPVLMTIFVFLTFCFLFYQMSTSGAFLFGALGAVSLSIQLHFASYAVGDSSIYPLIFDQYIQEVSSKGGNALTLLTQFMSDWYVETTRWTNQLIKVCLLYTSDAADE